MNCPPTKRQRRLNDDVPRAMASDDPFGDEEDFTQDDLDEIDVIASQAFPQGARAGLDSKLAPCGPQLPAASSWSLGEGRCVSRPVASHSSENTLGFSSSCTRPLVNRPQQFLSDLSDAHGLLEVQHAELKRKLKEVEEEIMLKNGEIRLLRDSLRGAQQEKEAQRQSQMLLDIQRNKEQSHKEKELNRKVQALQTELQFKEAEVNDMKSKLHSSDRKKTASLLPWHSPKVQSSLSRLNDGGGGGGGGTSSPVANGFITKEIFDTHIPSKPAPGKTSDSADRGSFSRKAEKDAADPFMSKRAAPLQLQGSVLLGLLLQQPLSPSSLGLSHLLSMSLTCSALSTGSLQPSEEAVSGQGKASLSQVQSLARNGLNMLSQGHTHVPSGTKHQSSCLGALLFLPLVDFHLSECLEALCSSAAAAGSDSAALTNGARRLEAAFTGFSVEDVGLAALRLLHLLVSHSDEVVEAVLKESLSADAEKKDSAVGLCSQNALLQSLLRLCEGGVGGSVGSRVERLGLSALKTLCVLIQRAPHRHSDSWRRVLQVVAAGLSTDGRVRTVSAYVHVLMSLCDQPNLDQHLCVEHDYCVFLKLFQFIRTRPDDHAAQEDWVQLDLQVVRLLSRMMSQRSEGSLGRQQRCQCHSEMVQTMVIVFHRQWLSLSDSQQPRNSAGAAAPAPWWLSPAASLLREALLLLHWLLLHHSSFSDSCRPLLHMYDQVVPAVQDLLRAMPERSESEEVALEEICRSDGDDPDDVDIDAVS